MGLSATIEHVQGQTWPARLDLEIAHRHGRSVLSRRRHYGPLVIQRPFYPEGNDVCHLYLLHPPGGVANGDDLAIHIQVAADASALITTPAAAKIYRCNNVYSQVRQHFTVDMNAHLEWLPQETIIYDGALTRLHTRVDLAAQAKFIGWDILCLGRPGANEIFQHGEVRQHWEIWRQDKPLLIERTLYTPEMLQARWGMGHQAVCGTLMCAGTHPDMIDELRDTLAPNLLQVFALTQLEDVLIGRYLGSSCEQAREIFSLVWTRLRPVVLDRRACAPRVWAT